MKHKWDVVAVGGGNTDFLVRGPRLPEPGETVAGETFQQAAGGKGANQAVAAARLGARVLLIARVGRDERGDAMLDTLHWSGGNTSLDALACGLPVVTLPGAFMRGRQSAAMLREVGVPQLVAKSRDDYVGIATRLVQDRDWRAHLGARIRAGLDELFDARAPMDAFARLLSESAPS